MSHDDRDQGQADRWGFAEATPSADSGPTRQQPSPVSHVRDFLAACTNRSHAQKLLESLDSLPHLTPKQQLGFIACVKLTIEEARK
jgi:hypothetical protein